MKPKCQKGKNSCFRQLLFHGRKFHCGILNDLAVRWKRGRTVTIVREHKKKISQTWASRAARTGDWCGKFFTIRCHNCCDSGPRSKIKRKKTNKHSGYEMLNPCPPNHAVFGPKFMKTALKATFNPSSSYSPEKRFSYSY